MSKDKKTINEGYQPRNNRAPKTHLPKQKGDFGYQPPSSPQPSNPPTSGSNAVKPKNG